MLKLHRCTASIKHREGFDKSMSFSDILARVLESKTNLMNTLDEKGPTQLTSAKVTRTLFNSEQMPSI